jgi:formylglycine-generating enzyme required for sulfatase activity
MKIIVGIFLLVSNCVFAQTKIILVGDVKDAATGEPLAYATIGVKGRTDQTISKADGRFELAIPAEGHRDTLYVTYVGYEKFEKAIPALASFEHVALRESATILEEVRIVHRQLDLRDIDRSARIIRDNLYAMSAEVTNIQYNDFLGWLEDYNKMELRKRYDFNLSGYEKSVRDFYEIYHKPKSEKAKRNDRENFNEYPAVNISYESAVEYCKWLTERYNESPKKKKFKRVLFRLPTLNEWQIAALGDSKFQSWDLNENFVETMIPKDTMRALDGKKIKMKTDTLWYPWYSVYFHNRVYNQFGCYLGNFRITTDRNCVSRALAYDGWTMQSNVENYFANNIGLYDVVGNVAEMIDEKGKACGGSWNDLPEQSTIHSIKNYNGPDETVGFRVFMEVIEK